MFPLPITEFEHHLCFLSVFRFTGCSFAWKTLTLTLVSSSSAFLHFMRLERLISERLRMNKQQFLGDKGERKKKSKKRDLEPASNGTPLQYSCLENPMDRGAWWAAVHGSQRVGHDWRLHFQFSLSYIGEGNGNPLQCSCLENPRDGGALWATIYGVAQSQT